MLKYARYTSIFAYIAVSSAGALAADNLEQAFKEGTPYLNMRYRYEFADQANRPEDAHASTLRTRMGYRSGELRGFSGVLEFENISQLGADNYNDTLNGRTTHPVVADPESTELNQAFLQYAGIPQTRIRIGREAIDFDNQRFIGSVDWRQNNQTLDNINLVNTTLPDTTFTASYVNNINRIFGEDSPNGDWKSDSVLLNISNKSLPLGTITGYSYLLDLEDAPAVSTQTYGLSFVGTQGLAHDLKFNYRVEYAHQSDYGNSPFRFSTDYWHIAPALSWSGLTVTGGYELLGSDNGVGFSTPLATAHKFNGFADLFLATPGNGLEDMYLDATYVVSGLTGGSEFLNGWLLQAQYHDFASDVGNVDYGDEIDFYTKLPFMDHYYVEAKYADYDADQFGTDTQRFIFGLGMQY